MITDGMEAFIEDSKHWAEIDANAFELIYMRDRYDIEDHIIDIRFRDDEIKRETVFKRVKEIEEEALFIEPVSVC